MSKRILTIGDINVDLMMEGLACPPLLDREVLCKSFEVTMGSTAVIFACSYASLGGDVWFVGLAGQDPYGDFMLEGLRACGVNTELIKRTDRARTGVTVNLIYESTRSQITYPGTIAEFSAQDWDESVLADFDHVHFAGPYLQTRFRPEIARLLGVARGHGVSTSLDPQWDPEESWEGMGSWLPLLDYLFVNRDEAISISGQPDAWSACRWLAERTACPIVKDGSNGAIIAHNGQLLSSAGLPVRVVDTTGAGDTFDAAFLFALFQRRSSIQEAADFANAAAARSCLFVGGVTARSTVDQVLALKSEIGE